MSKISLSPSPTGSAVYTIASPAGSTDRTLTLPDNSGTVVVTGSTELTPPGTVILYAANAAPTGYLKANGAAVSRTTFAALFTAIGTTFGAGDGSTTFALPDLRGEFPRGWADGRAVDTGRVFGSAQTDAMQGHHHAFTGGTGTGGDNFLTTVGITSAVVFRTANTNHGVREPITDGTNGTPRTAAETRARNIALLACIKF